MKALFPDWRAQGVTVCLHEHQGGFAFNRDSVAGLLGKAQAEGVQVLTGVEVTGFELGADDAVRWVETNRGAIEGDRKSTRLNSSHANISYAVFCLKKKKQIEKR